MNEMKLFVIFDWMEELLWSRLWMEDEWPLRGTGDVVEFLLSSKAFNPKDFSYRRNLSSKQKDTTFNLHEKVHENIRNIDTSLAMCLEK
jgi:hypothetical protein